MQITTIECQVQSEIAVPLMYFFVPAYLHMYIYACSWVKINFLQNISWMWCTAVFSLHNNRQIDIYMTTTTSLTVCTFDRILPAQSRRYQFVL